MIESVLFALAAIATIADVLLDVWREWKRRKLEPDGDGNISRRSEAAYRRKIHQRRPGFTSTIMITGAARSAAVARSM